MDHPAEIVSLPPASPDHLTGILGRMRRFVEEEVMPLEPLFLAKDFAALEPLVDQKRAQVRTLGLWAPQIPQAFGGMGLSLVEHGYVSEVLGRSPLGHLCFNAQAPDAGNAEILIDFGTPAQQEQFLRPLVAGEIRSCFSMTEPEFAGSNPIHMGTTAVREGDEWVINGHKWFTSSADGSAFAIVMVVTNPDADSAYRRASMIIVPTDTPGFQLVRNISVMGEANEGHASHAEIIYDNVRVPLANLLGSEGAGFTIAQTRLGPGRIHHCMRWLGICERAFDLMCQRAVDRALGPDRRLSDQQTIQNWVAESRAEINAARLMVLHAAHKIDREGTRASRDEISLIKFYVAGVLGQVLDRAIQTHGALGMTDDLPLAWWFRHERAARIYDGPDEVHKASVARRIFRRYQTT